MELQDSLINYIEKIEKIKEQIDSLQTDLRSVYTECGQNGFSQKAVKEIVKLRKMSEVDRNEFEFERQKYLEILKKT